MPAVSRKQRIAMAIAEHHPEKLYARNKSMKKMTKSQLHDFAKTKGLGSKKAKKVHNPHDPHGIEFDYRKIK
jgi:DNA integrity scanning protein DisA with diadenylate cyclase activity